MRITPPTLHSTPSFVNHSRSAPGPTDPGRALRRARRLVARAAPMLLCLGLAIGGSAMGGCSSTNRMQTRSGLTATYAFRTLSTELEPTVSVLTASAAAEQALRSRGYSISKSEASEDAAVVVGCPARGGDFDRAVVESRVSKTGTVIAVRIEPFGNEAASYAIMDALLMRMGR